MRLSLPLLAAGCLSAAAPELIRLHPLGGRMGTTVEIEISGIDPHNAVKGLFA